MSTGSIFITGAAAGIGRAIAEQFHADGWFVGLYDVNAAGVKALATELGERTHYGELDVSDPAAWQSQLPAFFDAAGGRLDVLVNNAGILTSGPFEDTPLEQHKATMDINVTGVMNGCHTALPFLKQTANSCVINMASASAIYGQPYLASYSTSKFAVRGFTEGLNLEWQGHGVRVVDIWPIFVQTNMVQGMKAKSVKTMGVKLGPADVAKVVKKAVKAGPKSRKVHWVVGNDAKLFRSAVSILPDRVGRAITGRLSTDH